MEFDDKFMKKVIYRWQRKGISYGLSISNNKITTKIESINRINNENGRTRKRPRDSLSDLAQGMRIRNMLARGCFVCITTTQVARICPTDTLSRPFIPSEHRLTSSVKCLCEPYVFFVTCSPRLEP